MYISREQCIGSLCAAVSSLAQLKRRCECLVVAQAGQELPFYAAEGHAEVTLFTPALGLDLGLTFRGITETTRISGNFMHV